MKKYKIDIYSRTFEQDIKKTILYQNEKPEINDFRNYFSPKLYNYNRKT